VAGQARQAESAERASRHAGAAGIDASFALALADLPGATDPAGIRRLEMRTDELARERQRAIAYLQQLADTTAAITRRVELARTQMHDHLAERDHAAEAVSASDRAHATAAAALLAAWRTFAESLRELELPALETLIELMGAWTDKLDSEDPCAGALVAQAQLVNDLLSELLAQARGALAAREHERAARSHRVDRRRRQHSTRAMLTSERACPARHSGSSSTSSMDSGTPSGPALRRRWKPRAFSTPGSRPTAQCLLLRRATSYSSRAWRRSGTWGGR
jgi:hypothetical protein